MINGSSRAPTEVGQRLSLDARDATIMAGTCTGDAPVKATTAEDYGKIKGTRAPTALDVYVGLDLTFDAVFVIDQIDLGSEEFDEDKVMIGFTGQDVAELALSPGPATAWAHSAWAK